MTGRQSILILAFHGAIVTVLVIAATVLGFHGTLDASAVTAIFGAALGFAGGTASSLGSLGAVVNGKSVVTQQQVAEQGAAQRTAIVAAAGGEARRMVPVEPVIPPEPQ